MNQNKLTPPNLHGLNAPIPDNNTDLEVWEPPFERWMKLADNLLTGWVCLNTSVTRKPDLKPRFAVRET